MRGRKFDTFLVIHIPVLSNNLILDMNSAPHSMTLLSKDDFTGKCVLLYTVSSIG